MASIYARVLGEKFSSLHPQLQKKFGLSSESKSAIVCTGVMDEIWGGKYFMRPFLMVGAVNRMTFAERGKNIPFKLENYVYKDNKGNECVAWLRKFHFPHVRHFDATMLLSEKGDRIVDFLGANQNLYTSLEISVLPNGGIKLQSGPLHLTSLRMKIPSIFTGIACAEEWYDETENRFHIHVEVKNKFFGTIFGYRGTFEMDEVHCAKLPEDVKIVEKLGIPL